MKVRKSNPTYHVKQGQAIHDFAYRMRGRRVERNMIASIDQVTKEAERIRFFEEILSNRRQ